jgi:hypothetical protein
VREYLGHNQVIAGILQEAPSLAMANWYLGAGCVAQTVWNFLHGFAPTFGIKDYHLVYHDASDLSLEAQTRYQGRANEFFAHLPATVEVQNQARVRLWYARAPRLPNRTLRIRGSRDRPMADNCDLGGRQDRRRWKLACLRPVWIDRPVQHDRPTQPDANHQGTLRGQDRALDRASCNDCRGISYRVARPEKSDGDPVEREGPATGIPVGRERLPADHLLVDFGKLARQ